MSDYINGESLLQNVGTLGNNDPLDARKSRKESRLRHLSPMEFIREVKLPLLEVEEQVIKSSQDDVAWSFALREFTMFSDDIQDAVWALLKQPDQSILWALYALMTKAITKKIMESDIRVTANLDLVESADAIVMDQNCLTFVQKVAGLLYQMQDERYEEKEINYVIREDNTVATIRNKTWMTQSLVESMLLSLQHSYMRSNLGLNEAMIGNLLKTHEELLPAVYDFFAEQVKTSFDENLLLVPVYNGVNSEMIGMFAAVVSQMKRYVAAPDKTGVPPRTINYVHLRDFLKECDATDSAFSSIFFCYLYPETAKQLFDNYVQMSQDEDFAMLGAPAIESWVEAAVASKTMNGNDFRFGIAEDDEGDNEARVQKIQLGVEQLVNESPVPNEEDKKRTENDHVPIDDFVATVMGAVRKTPEEYVRDLGNDRVPGITSQMTNDLAVVHSRLVGAAAIGEYKRMIRVNGHDSRIDSTTNELADLFPDQYNTFYNDMLADGLIVLDGEPNGVVANEPYMVGVLQARYPKAELEVIENHSTEATMRMYDQGMDLMLLDLNRGIYDTEETKVGRFRKTWASPFLVEKSSLRHDLESIYQMMGGEDAWNNDARLTAWIRLPVITDFYSFLILHKIMTSMVHRVAVIYPKRMHEPYFDLKIYPIVYNKKGPAAAAVMKIMARNITLQKYATRFYDHYFLHLLNGIVSRHMLWEMAAVGVNYKWKSHRYKLLSQLNFSITIDVERVKLVKKVVTHDVGRKVRRANSKIRARAMKKALEAQHARTDSVINRMKIGKRPQGMLDLDPQE